MSKPKIESPGLPEELVDKLREADEAPATITASVDRAIRARASDQFSTRHDSFRRRAPLWLAAAASLLVAVFLVQLDDNNPSLPATVADVDGSGQVDIVDVMTLALRNGQKGNEEALHALASQVVSLGDSS